MPLITATSAWQTTILSDDEVWQSRQDQRDVLVTADTPSGPDDTRGVLLRLGEAYDFKAGQTVSWRSASNRPGRTGIIHREVRT